MKHRAFTFTFWLVVIGTLNFAGKSSSQTNLAPARLAIISESSATSAAVDLLTVELSTKPQVQLLERAQIEKVYREQGMSSGNKDVLKLGQVLGADGLLVMMPVMEGTNHLMQVRLLAVKPGVVIAAVRSVWPVQDVSAWSHWLANHFDPLFPKLSVPVRDAIPISVVNLRSSVKSPESEELERQLTHIIVDRLAREQELFVLERRRMDILNEEKELKGVGESKFWNGSYLFDATIDRDGYAKDTATIHARLVPPYGGAAIEIIVTNRRSAPLLIADQLAAKIMEALQRTNVLMEWNPRDEAVKYFEEAKWALRWRMFDEAQAAAESAWALGNQDESCALLRIQSYAGGAPPAHINEIYRIGRGVLSDSGVENFTQELTAAHPLGVLTDRPSPTAFAYVAFLKFPNAERFSKGARALELFAAYLRSLDNDAPANRKEWSLLGVKLLDMGGQWLRDYYLQPKARDGLEGQLESVRRNLLETELELAMWPETDKERFWTSVACFGSFWRETPEEGVALYRKLFQQRQFRSVQNHVIGCYPEFSTFCHRLLLPMLAAWREQDVVRVPEVWLSLVDEMCRSTNSEVRGNGYFIQSAEAVDARTFVKAREMARNCGLYDEGKILEIRSRDFQEEQLAAAWEEAIGPAQLRQIQQQAESNRLQNTIQMPMRSPNLTNGVTKKGGLLTVSTNRPSDQPLEVSKFWVSALPTPLRKEYFYNDQSDGPGPGDVLGISYREGALWVESEFSWYADYQAVGNGLSLVKTRAFSRIDLRTFKTEVVLASKADYQPQDISKFSPPFRTFEVFNDHLYISSGDGIKRYSLRQKKWERLPVPIDDHARITAFDGRMFLCSATAIVEMSPDGNNSKVLASTRRVPPVTVLDRLDGFKVSAAPDRNSGQLLPLILPGPNGGIVTFVKNHFYLRTLAGDDWLPFAEIPEGREAERYISTNGLLVLSAPEVIRISKTQSWYVPGRELFLLSGGTTNLERIFADPPNPNGTDLKKFNIDTNARPSTWTSPEGMQVTDSFASLDDKTVWVLNGMFPNKEVRLARYSRNQDKPSMLSLRFQKPSTEDERDWGRGWARRWVHLETTPLGLVVAWEGVKGIWLVPAQDLQR